MVLALSRGYNLYSETALAKSRDIYDLAMKGASHQQCVTRIYIAPQADITRVA